MKYVPNIQKGKVKIHPKDDKFKINAERKSKVDDNTAKMQSIKQLGV